MSIYFKPAFAHYFAGTIWKMDVHEEAGLLAIEWREKSAGLPRFAVLHYPSGRLLAEDIQYGDRWWTLAAISPERLILQHYPEPGQAQTQALVLIDFANGNVVFEAFNLQFQELSQEGIAVKQMAYLSTGFSLLDEQGKLLERNITLNELSPLKRTLTTALPSSDLPPIALTEHPVEGPYFRLEQGGLDFWAYHEKTENGYRLQVSLLDGFRLLETQTLDENLPQLQPEVFFAIGQQLFFIRNNKQEFVSYFV